MAAAGSAASLSVFDYSQVELLDSPLRRQFDTNHAFFLHLDDDRMLKIYRQRVGMPAPGADMGGWYDDFCPGAHFGQYVSALARFARATDSETTRALRTVRFRPGAIRSCDRLRNDARQGEASGSRFRRNCGFIGQVLRGSALSGLYLRQAGLRAPRCALVCR